ncbi:hypothetical protein RE411_24810 (plasmid) [Agrobacterium pusense]|uniref:hypothetical protein n=1 Tax=Agrobacterium pusense TaxID=648995 RepID=UPI0013AE9EC1|nr:hypothetical protein [Agrobacterium pusense]WMW59016.1 hypothetical protein RE411_24810 [Agrobacterium pusense]
MDDRVADRVMRPTGMIVQKLVNNAGCKGYEVETACNCCCEQLRQCFELPEGRTQPEIQFLISASGNAWRKNV